MKELTVLSLFDGIACGRVALERAGIPVKRYIASEIEPNAIKVAMSNYPDIEQIGDVWPPFVIRSNVYVVVLLSKY